MSYNVVIMLLLLFLLANKNISELTEMKNFKNGA